MSHVEEIVLKRKRGHITNMENSIVVASRGSGGLGQFDLRLFHINTMNLSGAHRSG